VRNRPELESEYGRMHAIEPYPIIQEYIEGKGFGFFALYDRQRNLKARFCHKRLREYPARGGPSSCCEAVFDPELVRRGRRLLESLEWIGLAMVEFKFDEARKEYTVIEVNPRYWGSLPLAVQSGVNFPVLHALSALEHDYEPVLEYRLGVRVRFFDRDVKAILSLAGMEKRLSRKIALLLQIVNPALREGLFTFDDLGPIADRLFRRKRAGGSPDADG
jgi:predicted ATP-grasp superfamily ATP-dependent carboligase